MPRPRTKDTRIYWKAGRAYADFRDFARWGGKREALIPAGEHTATASADTAALLYAARLQELQALQKDHPAGLPTSSQDPLERFAPFAGYHLARRAQAPKQKRVSEKWLGQQKLALESAARFFAGRGKRALRAITSDDVREWVEEIRRNPPGARALSDATLRKYLDALGNLFRRAKREGRVDTNVVHDLLPEEKPTGGPSKTPFLEIPDAALYLEACRRWTPDGDAGAISYLYELVATYLMVGGRESEVTGLVLSDLDFQRDLVWFQPNAIRESLKTLKRTQAAIRAVPMSPQLKTILQAYLSGPRAPAGPLLFPGERGPDRMLTDFRKALDGAAALAGFAPGLMRTKVFRVTWVSARLQCTDAGAPISPFTVAREAGHGSLAMVQKVYGRLGRVRRRREHVEYPWEEYEESLGHRLNAASVRISDRWAGVLAALPRKGATAKEWERAAGLPVGTFYYARNGLLELGLAVRQGEGRGARFTRTGAGDQVLRSRETHSPPFPRRG